MAKTVAVVTCDIVGSRRFTTVQRRRIDSILKKQFAAVIRQFPDAFHTKASFSITRGDEFQFVLSKVEKAYEVTVFYRSLVAIADPALSPSFRSSIGIGEIAVENRKNSYSQDGRAFHNSRAGIDSFAAGRYKSKRLTKIITGNAPVDDVLDVLLMYQDLLEARWTRPQREAVRFRLTLPTYEEISKKIGIAYQNVQKRLKAAGWDEFNRGIRFIEDVLSSHLRTGELKKFTVKRV